MICWVGRPAAAAVVAYIIASQAIAPPPRHPLFILLCYAYMHSVPSPFVTGEACYAYACLFLHHPYFVFNLAVCVCIARLCPLFQARHAMRTHTCHPSSSSSPPLSCPACCIRRLHPPSTATMLLSWDGDAMPPPSVFHRLLLSFCAAAMQFFANADGMGRIDFAMLVEIFLTTALCLRRR